MGHCHITAPRPKIDSARDFYKLWTGQTISEIGSRITREGLPLTAVLMLGTNPAKMGILAAVGSASVLVFGVAAGVVADRMHRRPLMIATDLGRALLLATLPFAAWQGWLTYTHLMVIAVLTGILTVQFDVAYQSYLPALVPREDLLEGNRKLGMSASVAEILGPSLAGILIQRFTAPIAILVDAISFLVSAASVWAIRTPEPPPRPQVHESLREEALQGARVIWAHPLLRALALRSITMFFSMGLFFALYMLYAIRVLHMSTSTLGVTIAMGGVGSLIGAYLSARIATRFSVVPAMLGSTVIAGFANCMVPLAASYPAHAMLFMGTAQLFGDSGWAVNFVNETTLRQQLAPEHTLGRVNAAMQLASRGVLPVGALLGGFLAEKIGITNTIWIAVGGLLLSTLWLVPLYLKSRASNDVAVP